MSDTTVTAKAAPMSQLPQSGPKRVMLKGAILSLALLLQSISVTAAVVSSLKQDFPNASAIELQCFVTVPVLGNIIATLIGGRFATKIGKKNLCIIGTLLCFIGGFLPMFVPILDGQTALRVFAGFGLGLIQPLSASLIVDCFKGKEADTLMGFQSSAVGLGATIISSTIAGIMSFDWHYFYYVYFFALVVMVIVLFFIPNAVNDLGREEVISTETNAAPKQRKKMPISAYFGMLLQIIFATGYGFYTINLSLAAEETGTITAVQAATVITIISVSSLIGGLFFGLVKSFVGMWVGVIAIAMQGIALLIWGNTTSLAAWNVAAGRGFLLVHAIREHSGERAYRSIHLCTGHFLCVLRQLRWFLHSAVCIRSTGRNHRYHQPVEVHEHGCRIHGRVHRAHPGIHGVGKEEDCSNCCLTAIRVLQHAY